MQILLVTFIKGCESKINVDRIYISSLSKLKDTLNGGISIHHVFIVNHSEISWLIGWFVGWALPLNLHSSTVSIVNQDQQLGLHTKVHGISLPFPFVHYILDRNFGILTQKKSFIRIIYDSIFNDVVFGLSIFGSIMFDVNPKFILIAKHLFNFNLVVVFPHFLHYSTQPIVEIDSLTHFIKVKIKIFIEIFPFVLFPKHRFFIVLAVIFTFQHFLLLLQLLLSPTDLFPTLHGLKSNPLNHQLSLKHEQSLHKGGLCFCFQQIWKLQIVDKVGDHCLQLLIFDQFIDIEFSQKLLGKVRRRSQLIIDLVIVRNQSHGSLVVDVKFGDVVKV